jgi:hypothetical protein
MSRGINSSQKVYSSNSISKAHVFLWQSECEYAVKLIVKYDPELRAFSLEELIFVNNIHLLGGTQGTNAQGLIAKGVVIQF